MDGRQQRWGGAPGGGTTGPGSGCDVRSGGSRAAADTCISEAGDTCISDCVRCGRDGPAIDPPPPPHLLVHSSRDFTAGR